MNLRYRLRRLWLFLAHSGTACALRSCPENAVGFSRFCREHTDQIMEHRKCDELRDHLRALGFPS